MKIYLITLATAALLSGCGGGGGGGGSTAPASPATPVAATEPQKTMADLDVPDGFSYRTEIDANLSISVTSLQSGNHTLSVYSRFTTRENRQPIPEMSSRLISAPLTDTLESQFVLPAGTDQLLLEIWTVGNSTPLRNLIELDDTMLSDEAVNIDLML